MQNVDPGALYQKAMSSLGIGAALWTPEDRVEIGDVGYFHHGSFIRMFNVMTPPHEYPNQGTLPDDYEVLENKEIVKTEVKPMIKMKNVSLKSPSLSDYTSEPTPFAFPKRFRFVANGGPSAVLLTLEDAVVEEIKPDPVFETHFMNNHRLWISAARQYLSQVLHEEDLVLIRGHTKINSRWVAIAVQGSGSFVVEVNQSNGTSVTCDKGLQYAVHRGFLGTTTTARELHNRNILEGLISTPYVEEGQCLLVKYYCMKRRLWGSPKVVSVA
ncbi:hypothetical protein PsYK624_165580 [Phanerochaete sordida]|uniref:Uncharacterized protein n=1 Tax=Phanerochaete sordida TaxID=48140 RepID=A0A9P3LLZ4_9APHY|nr:hypothetical protein PsYK624_165580 [Phanerochaete sordida]